MEAINRLFAPEFRNRLDAVITFAHLSPEIISQVVEKFVLQLEAQLADRNVTIELSEEASRWLIANGYDELMGARPMARVIQEHIKKPLADEVLFGKLKNGGHVRVVVIKDEIGRDKLGFEYVEGPVTPKPETIPEARQAAPAGVRKPKPPGRRRRSAARRYGAEGAAVKVWHSRKPRRLPARRVTFRSRSRPVPGFAFPQLHVASRQFGDDVRFADDMIEKPARFLTSLSLCNAIVVSCDARSRSSRDDELLLESDRRIRTSKFASGHN